MCLRYLVPELLAALLLAGLPSCAGSGQDARIEDNPARTRDFSAIQDGVWIGNAVCYGPHRDGQRPGGASPSREELREDLALMLPQWKLLRIYAASGFAATLLELIEAQGLDMQVLLGVWIAPDAPAANEREIDTAIRLANEYPQIVRALSVGSETQVAWSSHRVPLDELIPSIRRVRERVAQPVSVADDFNFWNKPESRALDAEIDFIMMHAHPLWNGRQLEEALPWLKEQLAAVRAMHPGRQVVIGETGWATAVHSEGEQGELIKGRAGESEQAIYYETLRDWSASERVCVFFFEAFDENWKGGPHPNEVEKHWGLFRADRTAKEALGAKLPR